MKNKTFILIHGSWHSAWNWHRVTPLLEKQGHTETPGQKVYTMDTSHSSFFSKPGELVALFEEIAQGN